VAVDARGREYRIVVELNIFAEFSCSVVRQPNGLPQRLVLPVHIHERDPEQAQLLAARKVSGAMLQHVPANNGLLAPYENSQVRIASTRNGRHAAYITPWQGSRVRSSARA
jgi:hypothetical protein